ncbi:MAG: ATP-binding protein [Lachnospiraceae bacterium]|nr:ATP-binding protein [Lachnospiraceae bacterium]
MEMTHQLKLPVGIENFKDIRTDGYYYVDKTSMIRDLLNSRGLVNLFTRPRRFGKSLNMSMLKSFFEIGCERELFDGLNISMDHTLCEQFMGRFPVISISLKGTEAENFSTSRGLIVRAVKEEAERLFFLSESSRLIESERESYFQLLDNEMNDETLYRSLRTLSRLLQKHYGKKTIILIDEYDVPLAKANENNFYNQMVILIRNIFDQALKTNDSLYFSVLTGCLRVSKESIFTGLNNPNVMSVTDAEFDEYFGFNDSEVRKLLAYYGLSGFYDVIKEWYDGYLFGKARVYCPWDVICHVRKLCTDKDAPPENYWSNTSSNDIVRRFIQKSENGSTKREIENLVAGEVIQKEIRQELTYRDMYASTENIWSVLFMTGYLTQRGRRDGSRFSLAIPNREIRTIFTTQIMDYFRENVAKDGNRAIRFCDALKNGQSEDAETQFTAYLRKTISIRDTSARSGMKESFFHGILLGILSVKEAWVVISNRESGDGFSDILIEIEDEALGIVLEVKYADNGNLEESCRKAMQQIENMRYVEELRNNGMEHILKYGIACYKKRCRIVLDEESQLSDDD